MKALIIEENNYDETKPVLCQLVYPWDAVYDMWFLNLCIRNIACARIFSLQKGKKQILIKIVKKLVTKE